MDFVELLFESAKIVALFNIAFQLYVMNKK